MGQERWDLVGSIFESLGLALNLAKLAYTYGVSV
jgi:hypothetical protein